MMRLSTFTFLMLLSGVSFAQIPNAGFENWTTVGSGSSSYHMPTSWDNPNPTTSLVGVYDICDSGMGGVVPEGASYLKLTAKTVPLAGVVPGVAVTGTIVVSGTSYTVKGGFPNTTRPVSLNGQWQHMPKAGSGDHGRVGVFLWKWNSALNKRDTVALRDSTLTGSVTSWSNFTIPLVYSSGAVPDSAIIIFSTSASSSSAADSSYMLVDDLAFAGTVPTGVISVAVPNASSMLFPNPASGTVNLYYHSEVSRNITINICDVTGTLVKSLSPRAVSGENSYQVDLKGFAQGIYFVRIIDENGALVSKLMVE
jgi:hypothetical protein